MRISSRERRRLEGDAAGAEFVETGTAGIGWCGVAGASVYGGTNVRYGRIEHGRRVIVWCPRRRIVATAGERRDGTGDERDRNMA
jgi:hypothetical protein